MHDEKRSERGPLGALAGRPRKGLREGHRRGWRRAREGLLERWEEDSPRRSARSQGQRQVLERKSSPLQ